MQSIVMRHHRLFEVHDESQGNLFPLSLCLHTYPFILTLWPFSQCLLQENTGRIQHLREAHLREAASILQDTTVRVIPEIGCRGPGSAALALIRCRGGEFSSFGVSTSGGHRAEATVC